RHEKNISQTVQTNALRVFIEVVSFSIRTILKARNIGSLERAITLAIIEKEKTVKTSKQQKNDYKISYIKCDRCGKVGHYANECRSTILPNNNTRFRNSVSNREERPSSFKREYQERNVCLTKKKKTNKFTNSNNVNNEPIGTSYANRIEDEINQNQVRVRSRNSTKNTLCVYRTTF
ncbi:CCHC-type domain-containing protein, partial [Aphis craccivora]